MSRPLPPGDPVQLGPFRLTARLSETQAGIVYLGVDESGRRASVAVLNRGAAEDAAARDRFRAAITSSLPGAGGPSGAGPGGSGAGDAAPVVAAQPEGPAPWVATSYDADRMERAGAERFLEPVVLSGAFRGRWTGRRRGPLFQPYWLGSGEPALARPPAPQVAVAPPERPERGLVGALLTLAAILVALVLLMMLLFACQPRVSQPPPQPPDPPSQPAPPPPPAPTPSGSPSPSPSPAPTGSPTGTPSPPPDGGEGPPL